MQPLTDRPDDILRFASPPERADSRLQSLTTRFPRSLGFALVIALTVLRLTAAETVPPKQTAPTPAVAVTNGATTGTNPTAVATVNFHLRSGLVMVPATVNGSEPLSFMLDTGYSITTIHPDLAKSLQLRPVGKVTIVGIAGEEDAPTYGGAEFRIGNVSYSPRRVAAVPSEAERRRRRDGILGSGLFKRYVVQLEFSTKTLRLFDPATYHPSAGDVVPLRFRRDTPIVTATVPFPEGKSIEGQFEVDTGCDDGVCVGHEFVAKHRLGEAFGDGDGGSKQGVGGSARIRSGTIPVLRLGRSEARAVSASFFRDGSPAGTGLAGHIGMDTLRQFTVTFDYKRERIILEQKPSRAR